MLQNIMYILWFAVSGRLNALHDLTPHKDKAAFLQQTVESIKQHQFADVRCAE